MEARKSLDRMYPFLKYMFLMVMIYKVPGRKGNTPTYIAQP